MFSGKRIFPYLSWGLFVSLGLHQEGTLPSTSLKLSNHEGLLVPEADYHNPDPLPQDWMTMLIDKDTPPSRHQSSQHGSSFMHPLPIQSQLDLEIEDYSKRKRAQSGM